MSENRLLLVNYHYVRNTSYSYPGIYPVSTHDFAEQVDLIFENLGRAKASEIEAFCQGEFAFSRPSAYLTFDDGLLDHLEVAATLAEKRIQAAFFVPTRPILEGKALPVHKTHWLRATTPPADFKTELLDALAARNERYALTDELREAAFSTYIYDTRDNAELKYLINFVLPNRLVDNITTDMLTSRGIAEQEFCEQLYILTGAQIAVMLEAGHVVGCHGHDHVPLSSLDDQQRHRDISTSLQVHERLCGNRPTWISYPYGSRWALPSDPEKFCTDYGFRVGITLQRDWNLAGQDFSTLKRINTNEVNDFVG